MPSPPYYSDEQVTLHHGDALEVAQRLNEGAADCIVTSPPYFGLRDYGIDGQYGLESSAAEYVETMRALFAELRRVLADDGTLWLNIGDSYSSPVMHNDNCHNGNRDGTSDAKAREMGNAMGRVKRPMTLPAKNLLGIPWRVAFALQDDGWILRNAIIWNKPNAMPESVTDRLSGRYEHVFMFSKSRRYWFDLDPIREAHLDESRTARPEGKASKGWGVNAPHPRWGPHMASGPDGVGQHALGRNPGDVWSIPTQPFSAAHFAVMPVQLAQRCILAGCQPKVCLDCEDIRARKADVQAIHTRFRPGVVLDPFSGSGTTGLAAQRTGRRYIGIDLNSEYLDLSLRTRLTQSALDFDGEEQAHA